MWSGVPHCIEARRAPDLGHDPALPSPQMWCSIWEWLGHSRPRSALHGCKTFAFSLHPLGLQLYAKFFQVQKGFAPQTVHSYF